MAMPVSQVLSIYRTIKSMEAESRLGFITDVSMLFAGKGERSHIQRLIKQSEDGPGTGGKKKSGMLVDNKNGIPQETTTFIPGESYVVDNG
jgi:hypothetical protein